MRMVRGSASVLVISDLQIPFEHPDALAFVKRVKHVYGTDEAVCVGDEVDQMALSRFDPDPEGDGPGVELAKAVKALAPWYKAFPRMKVCRSNHTDRVYKKAFFAGIPEKYMRTIPEWLEAPPGWEWKDSWEIDDVRYEHGDAAGGQHAARALAERNRQSTVIGHHHSHGGVSYVANAKDMIFGMNVGCLINPSAIAFRYAKHASYRPTLGCGVVICGVPTFVPMLLNNKMRWIGEL